ncbi:MAG: tripartite tricarboxylate transporter TctB family protein [Neomegalonema sp.]|nr:tripartite tricarboxylate transporter TctB family protein [Neomegalonema sp.]
MGELTKVSIDFATSHLIFPRIVGGLLLVLGLAILISRRKEIAGAGAHWREIWRQMDKLRLPGVLALTLIYFSLMVPIGDLWPNTGMGFLICSIPFVFLSGLLFMHERGRREILIMTAISLTIPPLVWWLFSEVFFLTLP